MNRPGLEALLGGFRVKRFLAEHWPNTLLVQHGPVERFAGLADAPEFESIGALTSLNATNWLVQSAQFPNGFGNVAVSGEAAAAFFHAGFTIYGVEPELRSPSIRRWLSALERDLGLPSPFIRTSAFLSKPGPGARMHFDSQESFVVQLKGRKRWWLAPNRDVDFPTENYIAGDAVPASLEAQLHRPLATKLPADALEVVLKPGSIMFVPRGTWHATETLEESWHLDLMLPLPTWGDHVGGLLAAHFATKAHWRAPMLDAGRLHEHLRQLLTELDEAAPSTPATPTPKTSSRATAGSGRAVRKRNEKRRRSTR